MGRRLGGDRVEMRGGGREVISLGRVDKTSRLESSSISSHTHTRTHTHNNNINTLNTCIQCTEVHTEIPSQAFSQSPSSVKLTAALRNNPAGGSQDGVKSGLQWSLNQCGGGMQRCLETAERVQQSSLNHL